MVEFNFPLHFLRPYFLLSIIPIGLLLYTVWKNEISSYNAWSKFIDKKLLSHLLIDNTSSHKRSYWFYAACFAGALTAISLSGPSWERSPAPVFAQQDALVIVLDLSLSMYAEDGTPTRLKQALFKIKDLLIKRKQGLTGLVVFSGEAYSVTPLTDDVSTISSLLSSLSPAMMPNYGSNITSALEKAQELVEQSKLRQAQILVICDDVDMNQLQATKKILNSQNNISILAVGKSDGVPIKLPDGSFLKDLNKQTVITKINPKKLERFAQALNGKFKRATISDDDLNYLLPLNSVLSEQQKTQKNFNLWKDGARYFILLLIPFALLLFRKGYLLSLALVFFIPSQPSHALTWDSLFKNEKQQAIEAYNSGETSKHLEYFSKQSKEQKTSKRQATDLYNHANSLAKSEKLEDAIKKYNQALEKNPKLNDAEFNKRLVKKLLEQKKQQEQQEQQKDQQKDQQKEKNEQDQQEQEQNENKDTSESKGSDDEKNAQETQQNQDSLDDKEKDQQETEQTPSNDQKNEQEKLSEESSNKESEEQKKQRQQAQKKLNEKFEQERATQQWLDTIEEDPGSLLKNKFRYLYQKQQQSGESNIKNNEEKFW